MSTDKPTSLAPVPPVVSVLPFDAEKYLEHVNDCEMTEEQKTKFLQVLWEIMSTFVRLGFDVDSVLPRFKEASENTPDALELTIPSHEFNVAADDGMNNEKE